MTRKTTMLVLIEQFESDEPRQAVIETTGDLVKARPIRNVPVAPPSRGLEMQLGKLSGWLAKVAS